MADHIRTELVVDACKWRSGTVAAARRDPHSDHTDLHQLGVRSPAPRSLAAGIDGQHRRLLRQFRRREASSPPCKPNCWTARPGPPAPALADAAFAHFEGFYNPRRRHSTLGYLSPADYEHRPGRSRPHRDGGMMPSPNPHCPETRGHSRDGLATVRRGANRRRYQTGIRRPSKRSSREGSSLRGK